MTASDAYKAGDLTQALSLQLSAVKANPADQKQRLFLFELAAFNGDWERAGRQIDAIRYDEPELIHAVEQYRALVGSTLLRQKLFRDGVQPGFFGDPPEHFALRLDAIGKLKAGDAGAAATLIDEANAMLTPVAGTWNGNAFNEIRDVDDLFAGVLEVMAKGQYFWIPFDQIDTLTAIAPAAPRDLIWFPAKLVTRQGEQGDVYLPVLYPDSARHADDAVKLGRITEWSDPDAGPVRGVGQRALFVGEADAVLPDLREVLFAAG